MHTDQGIDHQLANSGASTGYLVSAPWRSSGKTLITLAVARLARRRGIDVQTFKKGPDYIDPQWLGAASGKSCYNLDPWMQSHAEVMQCYQAQSTRRGVNLLEGTMGLHDGMAVDGSDSNAAIAAQLGLPVLLVVDCRGMHRTVAALVNGVTQFDSRIEFAGIFLNRIRSDRHAGKILAALKAYTDVPVMGAVPDKPSLSIGEKELGLLPLWSHDRAENLIEQSADLLGESCDLDDLFPHNYSPNFSHREIRQTDGTEPPDAAQHSLSLATGNPTVGAANEAQANRPARTLASPALITKKTTGQSKDLRIGWVRDAAFNFYYPDDMEYLRSRSCELIELSALQDSFPEDLDGLVIGGGFPERYAQALSANRNFREPLAQAINRGLAVHAECAGLMYLCNSIQLDADEWPMAGAIDGKVTLHASPRGRGYMKLSLADSPTGAGNDVGNNRGKCSDKATSPGLVLAGAESADAPDSCVECLMAHEFHHSSIAFASEQQFVYRVERGYGVDGKHDGVRVNNAIGSYAHFRHTAATPWVDWFLARIASSRRERDRYRHV